MNDTAEDSVRIAELTSNAVRHSGEKMVQDVMATVAAAEQTTTMLREQAELLAAEIRKHSNMFADRVTTYVENCQRAVDMFKAYQTQIFDMDKKPVNGDHVPEVKAPPPINHASLLDAIVGAGKRNGTD